MYKHHTFQYNLLPFILYMNLSNVGVTLAEFLFCFFGKARFRQTMLFCDSSYSKIKLPNFFPPFSAIIWLVGLLSLLVMCANISGENFLPVPLLYLAIS